ncbi:MAG: hypothetical protein QOI93_3665, partial [Rhodospirillaceae bacterium]|nr:hypothetical protein [Rhodospirillaceae bacterium]
YDELPYDSLPYYSRPQRVVPDHRPAAAQFYRR